MRTAVSVPQWCAEEGNGCKSNKLVIVSPISASSQRRAQARAHTHTHTHTDTDRKTHTRTRTHPRTLPRLLLGFTSETRSDCDKSSSHYSCVSVFVFPLAERRCSFPWPNPAQTGLLTWCCLRGTRIGKAGCNKHGPQMLFSFGSRCWMEEVLDFEAKLNKIWSDFFFFFFCCYFYSPDFKPPSSVWFYFILASKLSFISLPPSHPTPAKAHLTWPADLWPLLLSAPLQTWEQVLVLPLISARPSLNSRLLPAHLLVAQTQVHQEILKNKRRGSASLKKNNSGKMTECHQKNQMHCEGFHIFFPF